MELRILRSFLAVAREQSISGAAKSLHLSQPSLSRQIMDLEYELGTKLFERGNRKITLTEQGILLRKRAEQIVELVQKTEEELTLVDEAVSGTVRIGAGETHAFRTLAQSVQELTARYPDVHFHLFSAHAEDVMERLDKGLIDLGIVRETFNSQRYESIWLPKEPWVVLLHRDTRLGQLPGNEIDLAALAEEPIIIPSATARGEEIRQWFHSVGVTPQVFCVYNAMLSAIMLVREKTGAALCPSSAQNIFSDKAIVCKTIIHPSVASSPVFIWKKYKYLLAAVTGFLQSVKKSLQ